MVAQLTRALVGPAAPRTSRNRLPMWPNTLLDVASYDRPATGDHERLPHAEPERLAAYFSLSHGTVLSHIDGRTHRRPRTVVPEPVAPPRLRDPTQARTGPIAVAVVDRQTRPRRDAVAGKQWSRHRRSVARVTLRSMSSSRWRPAPGWQPAA
jgi:hypothetical protein